MPDLASPLQIMDKESKEISEELEGLDSFYSIFDDKELVDCLIRLFFCPRKFFFTPL